MNRLNINTALVRLTESLCKYLRSLPLAAALAILLGPATAQGQSATSSDEGPRELEEIVVTAAKTGEVSLQNTSLAITAFTAADIEQSGIESVRDIGLMVPGMTITANEQFAQPFIRGIGSTQFDPGNESATAIHLDGVYMGRPVMLFTDFVDMERIEVIRGPSGTLYGRNATAGSINMVPKRPTDTFEGNATLEFGNFERRRVTASISGPFGDSSVSGRASFLYSEDDGFVRNLHTNLPNGPDRLAKEDITAGRLSLRAAPNDRFEFNLSADYTKVKGPNSVLKPVNDVLALVFGAQAIPDPWTVDFDVIPAMDHELWGITANLDYEFENGLTLTSITAYRESDYFIFNEEDGFEFDVVDALVTEPQEQFSQELRLLSDQSQKFSWLAGLFYFTEEAEQNVIVRLLGASLGDRIDAIDTEAYAVFAQATYQISDKAALIGGIRQSREEKVCDRATDAGAVPTATKSWSATTPSLRFDYQTSESVLLYASATRGFKSGACSAGSFVNPEYVWSYELGVKADWLDNRLRTNGLVFLYDYTDLQVFTFQGAGGAVVTSAPEVDIWGAELETTWLPTDNLEFRAGLAYLYTEYKDFFSFDIVGDLTDLSGNRLPFSPEWTFNVSGRYDVPLSGGNNLGLFAEYLWTDDVYHTQFNDEITTQDAYGLLNARIELSFGDSGWTVAAFGRNLTNEDYYDTLFQYGFDPDDVLGIVMPPRTYGIQARYQF